MKLTLILLVVLFAVTSSVQSQTAWLLKMQRIKLLSDTYDQVIANFGTPIDGTSERELSEYFDLKEGRLWVGFSSGRCIGTPTSDGELVGWRVPEWTVTDLSFRPNKPISPKKLAETFRGFSKTPIGDLPGSFVYRNDDRGISYSVTAKGKIEEVNFVPAFNLQHLNCGN